MILLTGATGFIGRALVQRLLEAEIPTVASVRRISDKLPESVRQVVVGDFTDDDVGWRDALNGVDVVVHLAARAHIMKDDAVEPLLEFRRLNRDATLHLARQAAMVGVKRFIFLSSIKVNGETTKPGYPFLPQDNNIPCDPYGLSKFEAEQGLLALAKEMDMEVVIIRPPLAYGYGVKGNFASLIKLVNKGMPLPLGAVHNKRSFVALDNLTSFIMLCADVTKTPQAANQIFLISDGEDVSTTQLLQKMTKAMGRRAFLIPVPVWLMTFAAKLLGQGAVANRLFGTLQVDTSKARDLLGWNPPITLDEGLRRAVADFVK